MVHFPSASSYAITPASTWSQIAFVSLIVFIGLAICFASAWTWRFEGQSNRVVRRAAKTTALFLMLFASVFGWIVQSGILQSSEPFPRALAVLPVIFLSTVALACSSYGRRIAHSVPTFALILFQAFRLPLELILHHWGQTQVIPLAMTFHGSNFDIITGTSAIIAGIYLWFNPRALGVAWGFNVIGAGLLVAVMIIAVRSMPLFVQSEPVSPPLVLVYHLPYAWILPFCVATALFGHIVLFRRLVHLRRSNRAAQ